DTTRALQKATPEDLRRQLKVVFEGEQGVDEGGLAREFFRLLSARVFTAEEGGLFDPAVAQNARVLWFNSASSSESTDFWLAGVILGLVVYNNMPGLDVRFPPVVFKKIKNEPLGLEDLRHVYPDTYLSLRSLLSWEPEQVLQEEELNAVFENTFCLDFVVTFEVNGKTESRELCKDGKDKAVTYSNREDFVRLYCEWLLTESVERQFEPFRKGVRRVCDSPLFNALHSAELELIVCGEQELEFSQLRKNAHYDGYQEDSSYIKSFWDLLLNFDKVQKKRFLSFVTGSDLAPVGGLQELQLVIQRNGDEPTERLPTAHTCFNLLLLPEYGSEAKLERMITTAMHNAEGMCQVNWMMPFFGVFPGEYLYLCQMPQQGELHGARHNLTSADFTRLASMTEGYSCSDLAALTREAAMGPVRGLRPEAMVSATPDGIRAIVLTDFQAAIHKVKPSLSKEALSEFHRPGRYFAVQFSGFMVWHGILLPV
ncbi:UBE3A, partial [Symbiodinium necroappetens]